MKRSIKEITKGLIFEVFFGSRTHRITYVGEQDTNNNVWQCDCAAGRKKRCRHRDFFNESRTSEILVRKKFEVRTWTEEDIQELLGLEKYVMNWDIDRDAYMHSGPLTGSYCHLAFYEGGPNDGDVDLVGCNLLHGCSY